MSRVFLGTNQNTVTVELTVEEHGLMLKVLRHFMGPVAAKGGVFDEVEVQLLHDKVAGAMPPEALRAYREALAAGTAGKRRA
jgi:hypothetical protein